MRIVYYTRPSFLNCALSLIKELSKLAEVHLLLEISPEAWQSGLFDVRPQNLPTGIVPADEFLINCFPAGVREYWKDTASFNLVVHNCPKSIHPSSWQTSRTAMKFINNLEPDVLHIDDVSLRTAWMLQTSFNFPVVLNIHDPEPHSGEKNWRSIFARRITFPKIKQFVLHNQVYRSNFAAKYHIDDARIETILLGSLDISLEWITEQIKPDPLNVLFFGRISAYKGLDTLYLAAEQVAKVIPGVNFVIAGRPAPGYLAPVAPHLANAGKIEVLDHYISNLELTQLLQKAALVVCPYKDATQSAVVLTAYSFGKPVIATEVGGLPEYIENSVTGFLVPPSNPEIFATAVINLLENPALQQKMSENTRHAAGTYLSWKRIANQVLLVYEKVTNTKRELTMV